MTPSKALVGLAGVCAALTACGGSPPPPPAAVPAKPVSTASTVVAAVTPPAAPATSPVAPSLVPTPVVPQARGAAYDPKGRRDPFVALDVTGGPKGLEVATTKLTGIIRNSRTALALVETSDGLGYILKPGDTLGDGRLVEVGADIAVFAVTAKPGAPSNRVVLKLAAN